MVNDPEMNERDSEWVRRLLDTFPPDALERLTRAEYDYYSTHGDYVPGLARLALYYRNLESEVHALHVAALQRANEQLSRQVRGMSS